MTSKNLFLTSMKENIKRRLWFPMLLLIVQLFQYPVAVAMCLNNQNEYQSRYLITLKQYDWDGYVLYILDEMMGISPMSVIVAIGFGVFAALQAFSYLHNRRKVDLYHSVPVSKKKRFWVIAVNSILIFAVINIICELLAVLVATTYGYVSGVLFFRVLLGIVFNMLGFLAGYVMTMLGVFLTGNTFVTLCAVGVFMGYEFLARVLFRGYISVFFSRVFFHVSADDFFLKTISSPVVTVMKLATKWTYHGIHDRMSQPLTIQAGMMNTFKETAGEFGILLLLLVVYGVIAYLVYLKRPSEAAGKAMAFSITKPIVKVLVIVPISLASGIMFYSAANESVAFAVFGLVAGLLLGHIMMEIIYEADIKAPLKHIMSTGISSVVTALIFGIFLFDLLGVDRYIPKAQDVESVAFVLEDWMYGAYHNFYEFPGKEYEYFEEEQMLDGIEIKNVDAMCKLAQIGLETDMENYDTNMTRLSVQYNMKNGKEVCRYVMVDMYENEELINELFTDEGYYNGAYQLNFEEFKECLPNMYYYYNNGRNPSHIYSENYVDGIQELYEAYRKEFNAHSFMQTRDEIPVGILHFVLKYTQDGTNYECDWNYPIYDDFTETKTLLEAQDIDLNGQLSADEIMAIDVDGPSEYFEDMSLEESDEMAYSTEWWHYEFKTREEIEEIIPYIYPAELLDWRLYNPYSEYSAQVTFRDRMQEGVYCNMLYGQIPDIVKEKIGE